MSRARRNPIGLPAPLGAQVVRVGSGEHTHVYNGKGGVLCNSGKGAGRVGKYGDRRGGEQTIYATDAHFVTCYRCQKLAQMNLEAGRDAWQGPQD
jgi:hypothetical protein